jgi:hypothetical protein
MNREAVSKPRDIFDKPLILKVLKSVLKPPRASPRIEPLRDLHGWRSLWRRAFVFCSAPLPLLFCAAAAGAGEAASEEPLQVKVDVELAKPSLHHNMSLAQIRNLMGGKVAGFTDLQLQILTNIQSTVVSHGNRGEKVMWISEIQVTLAYRSIDVYLPREHRKGTCLYRALLDHENEHIRVDQELVQAYAEKIRQALEASTFPTHARPLRVASESEAKRRAEAQLNKIVQPLYEELKQKREEAKRGVDAPEKLESMQSRCTKR